jgi:hypothetical protein
VLGVEARKGPGGSYGVLAYTPKDTPVTSLQPFPAVLVVELGVGVAVVVTAAAVPVVIIMPSCRHGLRVRGMTILLY